MLENVLKVGSPSPLPTDEAGQDGAGTLCSFGIKSGNLGEPGGDYNPSSFANFGGQIHLCLTQCVPTGVDVRPVMAGGSVRIYRRPKTPGDHGSGWTLIPDGQFVD